MSPINCFLIQNVEFLLRVPIAVNSYGFLCVLGASVADFSVPRRPIGFHLGLQRSGGYGETVQSTRSNGGPEDERSWPRCDVQQVGRRP